MPCYSSRLLTFLWASALIFSGLSPLYGSVDTISQWPSLLSIVAGLTVLGAPRSLVAVAVSAAGFFISFTVQMPINPNHRWILFYVTLAIISKLRTERTVDSLWRGIQGSLQWLTVVVYSCATLAKLNTTYFTPEQSCAGVFGWQTLSLYGLTANESLQGSSLLALVTVLVEGLLPFMLLWRRTRCLAVCCGILFHIGLSLNFVRYFGNFSAAMFLLLASFLPEESCERAYHRAQPILPTASRVWAICVVLLVLVAIFGLASLVQYGVARHVLYALFAVSVGALSGYSVSGIRCAARVGHPQLLIIALAVVNASAPYVGLKTRSALTMYSNLRIEPGFSNHLFMPRSPDLFGYLSDTVHITACTDPMLQDRLSREGHQLTYLSLCAYLACQDDLCSSKSRSGTIAYYHRGELVQHNLESPLPADCPSWLARKALLFGPTGPDSERVCIW